MKHLFFKNYFFSIIFMISVPASLIAQNELAIDFCISQEEQKLFNSINDYRKVLNLSQIQISPSLCYVANQHINDLIENHPDTNICNFHSWSDKGKWQGCCYEKEINNKKCMQEKPLELTAYPGLAYEIVYWENGNATANSAFDQWRSITASRAVITNFKEWESFNWNAVGVSIKKGFAIVWFGEEADPILETKICGTTGIIKHKTPSDPDEAFIVSTNKGRCYIIFGNYSSLEEAKGKAKELRAGPFKNAKVLIKDNKYRVSLADYSSKELAQTAKKELPEKYKEAWVLSY